MSELDYRHHNLIVNRDLAHNMGNLSVVAYLNGAIELADFYLSRITEIEDRLFAKGEMMQAPCFCCGYNGADYFHSGKHLCAERHHRLFNNINKGIE